MAYRWPAGTTFKRIDLDVQDRSCPVCGRDMHVCDHRYHHLWTLQGPTQIVNRLVRCPDASCASRGCTFSPEAELSLSMPRWCLGWDVLCWLGHRRFARHWSVPQLRLELQDTHQIRLSDDAIENYIGQYQTMLAARQQDPERLAEAYRDIESLALTIDGLQPEKGHETLYVVRALQSKRVWFAEPLLSSAEPEVRRLIRLGASVGRALGQAPTGVEVGEAGCLRQGHCRRVFRHAAPLLPQPLSARLGPASAGAGESCEGQDAPQSAGGARYRTARAGGPSAHRCP